MSEETGIRINFINSEVILLGGLFIDVFFLIFTLLN